MTSKEYNQAIEEIRKYPDSFDINGDLLRCLDFNCFQGRVHSDSVQLTQNGKKALEFTCEENNNFVEDARRLIVCFKPKTQPQSFETFILLLKQKIENIEENGWSQEKEDDLNDTIKKFLEELQNIQTEIDSLNYMENYNDLYSDTTQLLEHANHFAQYRLQCLNNRCGVMGHGNPATGIVNRNSRLCSDLNVILPKLETIRNYVNAIIMELSNVVNMVIELRDSNPAHHTKEAEQKIQQTEQMWQQLITEIGEES